MRVKPLSAYPPELVSLFKKASEAEVAILVDDHRAAMRYRQTLYNVRQAMRNAQHQWTQNAEHVTLTIRPAPDSTQYVLRASPTYAPLLAALQTSDLPAAPTTEPTPPSPAPEPQSENPYAAVLANWLD